MRFTRVTRQLARLRWHRPESRALVAFLVMAGAGFAVLKLASEVAEGDTFAIDKAILRGLRTAADPSVPIGPDWLRQAMIDLTALGGVSVLTLITLCALGFLLAIRKRRIAAFLAASTLLGAALGNGLKVLLGRPRPEIVPHLVEVHTLSFPSGHAMNSAIIYLTLGVMLARSQSRRSVQLYLMAVALALVLLVGISRVYLGVHWPSDVLAGWTIGALWAVLTSLLSKRLQRQRALEAPTG